MNAFYLIILVILMALSSLASAAVSRKFNKYASVRVSCGKSADRIAQELLNANGSGVTLQRVSGSLTDHYDPSAGTVGLSEPVYGSCSLAAVAVAAHEIGHVMQYQEGYGLIGLRTKILPVANIASNIAPYIVIAGLLLSSFNLAMVGVVLYSAMLLFQFATLPVEINASNRALDMLENGGYITRDERGAAKEVLKAAAKTYLYAALSALVSFLRLFSIASRTRRK